MAKKAVAFFRISLALELNKEFTSNESFRNLRMAIEQCKQLYKSWGGAFDSDQINQYLNFFDNMGFYWHQGDLNEHIVDQMFGPYIIEAYEYDELRRYMDEAQRNTGQEHAFDAFEQLAKALEGNEARKGMLASARKCNQLELLRHRSSG